MKTDILRRRLLATTMIAGAVLATPAFAQQSTQPTNDPVGAGSATAAPADQPRADSAGQLNTNATPTQGSDVVVTGSRISNPNLTSISPLTVVTSAEVKNQGNARVEDLLNTLPQVFASEGSTDSNGASGIATVDLRGLGTNRTLVLINGRRLGAGDPTDIASDLNFIPGSLIKRVDVLTGGASAAYGSDAVAGVVNFVLNTDYEGFQLDAQTSVYNHNNNESNANYNAALAARGFVPPRGNTADGAIHIVNFTFGASTADGRGHITAYGGWRQANAVTQGDRDFSYCGYTASSGGSCAGSGTTAFGRFRRTVNGGLGATPVYQPTGTTYSGNLSVRNAAGGFGTYSNARDGYNFNPTNYFQRPDTRYTLGAFANYKISDAVQPYLEVMFMDDHSRAQIAASGAFYGTDFFVNCNNPLLNAAQQTQLCGANAGTNTLQSLYIGRRNVEGGGRVDDLRHTDYRAVVGVKGDIAKGVSYDLYYQLWRSELAEEYFNDFSRTRINRSLNVVTGANGTPVCASSLPNAQGQVVDANCVPWNIFSGTTTIQNSVNQGVTQAALNYLQTPGFQNGNNKEDVVSGSISIDLSQYGLKSPFAGTGLQAVFGGEYRREQIELNRDVEFLTGDLAGQGTPFGVPNVAGTYNVKEFFTEVQIPIVSDKPGIEVLGLDGAYRYSDYSIQGHTNTYKAQIEYAPVRAIRFRGGYNRAVRAPNTLELFSAPQVTLFAGQDPCAGDLDPGTATRAPTATLAQCQRTGVTAAEYGFIDPNPANQLNQQTSGNVNLRPEKSDTYTGGVVLNVFRSLTVSADYFNIKVNNVITSTGAATILNDCLATGDASYCSLINRAPGGSLYTGTGYVSNPTFNAGNLKTSGVDVNATYRMNIGTSSILVDLVGTYLDNYSGTTYLPVPNCAAKFGGACGTPNPRWRSKLRATYTFQNGIGLTGAWRYFSAVRNTGTLYDTDYPVPEDEIPADVRRIGSQSFFDLALVGRIADHYTFRIGAQNILDRTPPLLDSNYTNNGSNTYAQVYDSLGRYIYASVQLNF